MTATSDVTRKPDITNKCRNDADDPIETSCLRLVGTIVLDGRSRSAMIRLLNAAS